MSLKRSRLRIEQFEDRITPTITTIGTSTGAVHFNVAGYTIFQNGGVTFATTSSAFGFSEASMTAAQAVTTLNGGTVMSTLNDGFDGGLAFGLPDGSGNPTSLTYADTDGIVDLNAGVGGSISLPVVTGSGASITGDPATTGTGAGKGPTFNGLELWQQNTILDVGGIPVIRSLFFVRNPSASPITQSVAVFNNLGSDANTTIFSTSSGDSSFQPGSDQWVGSFQNYSGTTSSDPRILFGFQGNGSVRVPLSAQSVYANGDDNPHFNFDLTLAAGETQEIMIFTGMFASKARATTFGANFNSTAALQSAGLLQGLTSGDYQKIVNWTLDTTAPTAALGTTPPLTAPTPSTTFTVTFTDDVAISAATIGNGNIVVTGPNGYSEPATLVSVDVAGDGTPRTATYTIPAPGGNWDGVDNGTYTITLNANQVTDVGGNPVAGTTLGSFVVNIPVNQNAFRLFTTSGSDGGASVRLPDGSVTSSAVSPGGQGSRAALGDVTGDGVADTVIASGPSVRATITLTDGATGTLLRTVTPFEDSFTGGAFVALGDVNGDGLADVAVSADTTGGARVTVYSGADGSVLADYFGIEDDAFRGGARVALGDVNGDGLADLVVAAGTGGGPRVAVFDGASLRPGLQPTRLLSDFFAFEPTLRDGAFVTVGDINGDRFADLVFGGGPGGGPRVLIWDGNKVLTDGVANPTVLANFFAADPSLAEGVRVTAKDLDGDQFTDLVIGVPTGPTTSKVTSYLGKNITASGTPPVFNELDPGVAGVFVG